MCLNRDRKKRTAKGKEICNEKNWVVRFFKYGYNVFKPTTRKQVI